MLVVFGTNVHWGDPVNTASKLSEDLANDQGHICITREVRDAVRESLDTLDFVRCTGSVSGVDFIYYKVEGAIDSSSESSSSQLGDSSSSV